jgi:hypothetical protein
MYDTFRRIGSEYDRGCQDEAFKSLLSVVEDLNDSVFELKADDSDNNEIAELSERVEALEVALKSLYDALKEVYK